MTDGQDGVTRRALLGGRYRVEEELGRGGMARVFRGTDTVLGRPVAIKILAPQFAEDAILKLVNHRWKERLETLVTSNLTPDLIAVYWGQRVASRIEGFGSAEETSGPDRRRT